MSTAATSTLIVLVAPTSSSLPFPPPPPPPFPPEEDDTDDDGGDISDDDSVFGGDDDDDYDPAQPTSGVSSTGLPPSSTSSLSSSSTALAISVSNSLSKSSDTSRTYRTTLQTSTTSRSSQTQDSTAFSSSVVVTSSNSDIRAATSTSMDRSTVSALPIGQPDRVAETKAGSSPLGTAGIALAAIFGFVALITTIYLLYRLRRRRQTYKSGDKSVASSSFDAEKASYTSTTQETGIIFGRRRSSPKTTTNPFAQQDDQPSREGQRSGRSRLSFLNRRWYSTGTQFSDQNRGETRNQNINQTQYHQQDNVSPSIPSRWTNPLSSLTIGLGLRGQSRTNSQYYPPPTDMNAGSYPQEISSFSTTPSTPSTITRLTTEINRNISTRSNDSESSKNSFTSQPGSGHARAYAHHGIRAPRSIVAARSTISSISTRWLRRRSESDEPPTPSRSNRNTTASSAVSEVSDMYGAQSLASPISPILPVPGRFQRRESYGLQGSIDMHRGSVGDGYATRRTSSIFRMGSKMPRLPLPVVVSSRNASEGARASV